MESRESEAGSGNGGVADGFESIDGGSATLDRAAARIADEIANGDTTTRNGGTEPKAALTKSAFVERAKAFKVKPIVERVPLPWLGEGEHAFVRALSSSERDDFEASLIQRDEKSGDDRVVTKNIRAKFLLRTLSDADGVRLFADHEVGLLSGLDAKTADALYERGRSLSGVTDKDIKEMAKNSEAARSGTT